MQATIDTDVLQEAIKVCLKLGGTLNGNVTLHSDGSRLFMHSAADLSRCTVLIPCEVQGKATFAIPTLSLSDACTGHESLEMSYDKTMLNLKSGRYKASLTTQDALAIEEEDKEEKAKGQEWRLSVDQMQWLKDAVDSVALKPTQNITGFMPVNIKLTPKSAFVSCYDVQHMAFVKAKEITGDLDVTLPIDMIRVVLEVFNKMPCRMTVTSSALMVRNKLVNVSMALPSVDETEGLLTGDMVYERAVEAVKTQGTDVELDKKTLATFLQNCRSVATKEVSELHLISKPGKVRLQVKTTNGIIETILKSTIRKAINCKINFEFFDEAVRKSTDNVIFRSVEDSFLMFKIRDTRLLMALNQDDVETETEPEEEE